MWGASYAQWRWEGLNGMSAKVFHKVVNLWKPSRTSIFYTYLACPPIPAFSRLRERLTRPSTVVGCVKLGKACFGLRQLRLIFQANPDLEAGQTDLMLHA
jgi:hypothetical protein